MKQIPNLIDDSEKSSALFGTALFRYLLIYCSGLEPNPNITEVCLYCLKKHQAVYILYLKSSIYKYPKKIIIKLNRSFQVIFYYLHRSFIFSTKPSRIASKFKKDFSVIYSSIIFKHLRKLKKTVLGSQ